MGMLIIEWKGQFGDKCGASHYNQWGLCGIVILCQEGSRRGFSLITLGLFFSIWFSAVDKADSWSAS